MNVNKSKDRITTIHVSIKTAYLESDVHESMQEHSIFNRVGSFILILLRVCTKRTNMIESAFDVVLQW